MNTSSRFLHEKESAWLYRIVAEVEPDAAKGRMVVALATAADEQAEILRGDLTREGVTAPRFAPSLRAHVVAALVRALGPRRTRPLLAAMKVRGLSVYAGPVAAAGHALPTSVAEIGRRHARKGGAFNLRAAVFGVNDGLVSNASLIMGVAGASSSDQAVVVSGVAGLLAGAFSMAAGEWVSVRSEREMYEHQIGQERDEITRYPAEEAEELALIYAARGVPLDDARAMALRLMGDPDVALGILAREELGLNPDDLASPWAAAISSFLAFVVGAAVPLLPYLVLAGGGRLMISAGLTAASLFGVGMVLSLFSGRHALAGGLRMLLIGGGAGAATWALGSALGASLG